MTVAQLLDDFAAAPPDRVEAAYLELTGALWNDGKATEAALPAVPELITQLSTVEANRQGHLALLLGYSGAKAYWALRHGTPTVVSDVDGAAAEPASATPGEVPVGMFGRFGGVLRCTACRSTLDFGAGVSCAGCGTAYSTRHGVLD